MTPLRKTIVAGGLAVGLALAGGAVASASTTYTSYDVTTPRFNGDAYSGWRYKDRSSANGGLYSGTVGGSYRLDVRAEDSTDADPRTSWYRIGDNTNVSFNMGASTWRALLPVRVHFSNDATTPVSVRATGSWFPN